jgi:hypothetical protein
MRETLPKNAGAGKYLVNGSGWRIPVNRGDRPKRGPEADQCKRYPGRPLAAGRKAGVCPLRANRPTKRRSPRSF